MSKVIANLNRPFNRRKGLVRGLANDLIMFEKVDTTLNRAKATQSFIERLITKAKEDSLANKRAVESQLGLDNTVKKMFELIGPRFKDRPGGYTRIVKLGNRKGDNAIIARLEFTDLVSQVIKEPKKEVKVTEEAKKPLLRSKPKVTVRKTTKKVEEKDAKGSKKQKSK